MRAQPRLSAIFKSASAADTLRLAGLFAGGVKGGSVLSLEGPIGAGKTLFVKGLAGALGAKKLPVSASFNIMRTYLAGLKIYHFDLFRVAPEEIENIGLEDYLGLEDGVSALEWAAPARQFFERSDFTELVFFLSGGDSRRVLARAHGPESRRLIERVKKEWKKK
ncbi:MAG TPA: tRNA (adenosine(37)-N6)-threonylcarbamoyltransferase complex ATPase subunit type 1 TsaE [Elusimicrobia bacterium]|nr:tRNA (adenosine(37)-N6)-threonylcarbamoyltransferase complex ATPase subunit type 1 TsaE [Elusimicrobiota bacterium]